MALDHIVVVGGSLAGTRGAETLRREGFTGAITMVGAETELPYERPALSKQYLSGKWDRDRVFLRTDGDLAADLGIEIRLGTVALSLDLDGRRVLVEPVHADHSGAGDLGAGPSGEGDSGTGSSGAGESIGFDGLFIATGARVRELPGSKGLGGVHTLRTLADADRLKSDLARKPKVAVIGAGFIGSEVASTCRGLGLEVTVIEALPQPLSRVLGDEMGAILAGLHRQGGTDLRLGIGVDSLVGSGRVEGVKLAGGEVIGADVVVVGIGVVPNTEWLEGSGLTIDNGVVCDPACGAILVSGERAPGVVAAGDVARWHHGLFDERMRLEHWDNAILQAEHAARTL
ncbi:MAG: NAD(P)/FAD-dependent oxidoreductase, partial [Acidimicrobiales bacterium]